MSGHERRRDAGLALPVALLVLLLIGALALALVTLAGLEPAVARNLADATRARLLAEAGLERARGALVATTRWTDLLGPEDETLLLAATPMPGRDAREGTHTVRIRNDWRAADTMLTGQAPDAGGRERDTNDHLLVAATGSANRARRTVLAVARRLSLPTAPAAVAVTGVVPGLRFTGEGPDVDGHDHAADGSPGACPPAWAVAVADAAGETGVESAVPPALFPRLRGRPQDDAVAGEGPNTIAPEPALDASAVAGFIESVRSRADVIVDARDAPLATRVGTGCELDPPGDGCWGTAGRPRVVHVTGPSSDPGVVVEIAGPAEGHGVLVVEHAVARITGDFRWRGLIVVTGPGAGLELTGEGAQTVLGGVVIDRTGAGPGLVAGGARLLRSCETLEQAARARRLVTLSGWHEVPLY